ncbi:DUF2269 family protein [Cohnella thailandensis]|uniref:DUF2269 domain-containing protein n=1 Tax=Cohnella thailandensis TaxID=557557 RepID=A0A841SUZ9_9BACL|nr:DUF2269 family protein [Cohnella thailandensis]MBB6633885.1 DUF2269 domain-containing protein [Cohnella thailandensis]MBP1972568.1 putative membrane protein [Cohnella thailandensis]
MGVLLTLHVLGAILFVGNIVTAAFWQTMADVGGNPAAIHQASKFVMKADWAFTLPGLALLVVTGGLMAERGGYSMGGWNWLTLSLALFALTGILWAAFLIPLQRKMIRLSADAVHSGVIPAAYRQVSRNWAIFGSVATLLPVANLILMVIKPVI